MQQGMAGEERIEKKKDQSFSSIFIGSKKKGYVRIDEEQFLKKTIKKRD